MTDGPEEPPSFALEVRVHDAAHLEWEVSAPLPAVGVDLHYEVTMTMEVPDGIWAHHEPWNHFRVRSRLQAPSLSDLERPGGGRAVQIWALATVREAKARLLVSRRALRESARSKVPLDEAGMDLLALDLRAQLEAASHTLASKPDYVEGEGAIEARDYLDARYWLELSDTLALLDRLCKTRPPLARLRPILVEYIVKAIDELREHVRFNLKDARGREELVRWVSERKRLFHRRLFLDAVTVEPDRRFGNWIAAVVAVVASTWAFIWQLAWTNQMVQTGLPITTLFLVGAFAGVLYAVKDRIKEVGRRWLSDRLRSTVADRVVRLYLRPDTDARRAKLGRSMESIRISEALRPDGTQVTQLEVKLRLTIHGRLAPLTFGIRRVKHFMRYDFSRLLLGLERASTSLAVPHAERGMHVVEVAKTHELDVVCVLSDGSGAIISTDSGRLLVSEKGLTDYVRGGA